LTRWLLALAFLPSLAWGDEPFVSKPSRMARVAFYGSAVAADAGTTLWARSRGAQELNPWLQDEALMVAFKVAQAAVLVWLDGKLPPSWRWVLRGAAVVGYGALAYNNFRAGKHSRPSGSDFP